MNLNLLILYITILIFTILVIRIAKFHFRGKAIVFKLIAIFVLCIIVGSLKGILAGKDSNLLYTDIIYTVTLMAFFISPFLFYNLISQHKIKISIIILSIFYTGMVLLTFLVRGLGDSLLIGGLFSTSTINYSIISIFSFLGLGYYVKERKIIGLCLALLAWISCVLTLSKWLLFVHTLIPFAVIISIFSNKKNKSLNVAFGIAIIIFLIFSLDNLISISLAILDYGSLYDYLSTRVFGGGFTSFSLDSLENTRVLDGSRYLLWGDLLTRTINSPIFGIGFGARALDYFGYQIDDHNAFVFMVSRYGIVIFIFLIYYIYKLYKLLYLNVWYNVGLVRKIILIGITLNVLLQINTGMQWRVFPYILVYGYTMNYLIRK